MNTSSRIADHLQALFLTYINGDLTFKAFAEHHGMTTAEARAVLAAGRAIHNSRVSKIPGAVQFSPAAWGQLI